MKKITIVGLGNMGLNFINSVNKDFKKNISDIEINSLLLIPKELDKDFIELVDILKRIDINPNVIVLKPFAFEGKEKVELANSVIEKLNDSLNNLKIFDNNDIESLGDKNLPMKEMFTLMDKNIFKFIIESVN